MKKLLASCIFILILLTVCAYSETRITLSDAVLFCNQEINLNVVSTKEIYQYSVSLEGNELFTGPETEYHKGVYVPRAAGKYTVSVKARNASDDTYEISSATCDVIGTLDVDLSVNKEQFILGNNVKLKAITDLNSADVEFTFIIYLENNKVWQVTGHKNACDFHPTEPGNYTAVSIIKHKYGQSAEASVSFSVLPGNGLSIEGSGGMFFMYGGKKEYTIHSDSIWTAKCDNEHFILDKISGDDGEKLTVYAVPKSGTIIRGNLIITTADEKAELELCITANDSIEEEITLEENGDEDSRLFVVSDQIETHTFSITADNPWHCILEEGDAELIQQPDLLTCILHDDPSAGLSYCHIRVSDGTKDGHIVVFKHSPIISAQIIDLKLSNPQSEFFAYKDLCNIIIACSENTQGLQVDTDWGEHLILDKLSACDSQGYWHISLIPGGKNIQRIRITPLDQFGSKGIPVCTDIFVVPENSAVLSAEIRKTNDSLLLSALTTAKTTSVFIEDEHGKRLAVKREEADIDFYIDDENNGRYLMWYMELNDDENWVLCGTENTSVQIAWHVSFSDSSGIVDKTVLPYNQFDGSWYNVPYRKSELQTSGCAIFTLATALHVLGYEGEETEPDRLADKYKFCLVEGGTLNSTLIGNAGKEFNFRTRFDLYNSKKQVLDLFKEGAVFSFSVVQGHIALIDRCTEDGAYFHIMDSALTATFSRIKNTEIFVLSDGIYIPVDSPEAIENARYYIETNAFSGGEYWLESDYCLKRGVRLILPRE